MEPLLSVVVPVLNEEETLARFAERLRTSLDGIDGEWEAIYVDDGSTDGSLRLLKEMAGEDRRVTVVRLSRNFGMDIAMSAGLDFARGRYTVLIHSDLQDPPELIPQMVEIAEEGADVVFARRIGSDESRLKVFLATRFYRIMERIARVPYQGQAGDFRLLSRRVVDALRQMRERRRFLRGMVAWVGFRQVPIEYRRAGRLAGRGASYPDLFRLAVEAMTAFSDVPLNLAAYFGMIVATLSAVAGLIIIGLTVGGTIEPSGYLWVLLAVLFLGGIQLITVGILGRYLARVHEENLERPLYVVEEVLGR